MIPIIWRFLIGQYLKVMGLSVVAFIAVLLVTRLNDIAHFCSLDATGKLIFLFILYQIPFVLPIALPIACLLSAILLVQQLSKTHELTALRACGVSIQSFMTPIFFVSGFLALINFYIVSELTTTSHLHSNLWKCELKSINPLLLLRNKHLMRMRGAYCHALGHSRMGESASQVVMAIPNKKSGRIHLLLAEELSTTGNLFLGKDLTLVTAKKHDHAVDDLMIENIGESTTTALGFSQLFQEKAWKVNHDHLQMGLLLSRLKEEKKRLAKEIDEPQTIKKNINRCYSEIIRRLSVALAVFTFTFLGAAFGIRISRRSSNLMIFCVIGLAAGYLAAYFMAKGVDHAIIPAALIYLLPHVILVTLSIWVLKRVSKGIE